MYIQLNPTGHLSESLPKDDKYLELISQYKDKSWYNQLLDNPWLYSKNDEFSPNFWQSIGEAFGDTSARDRYYSDLRQNQNTWLDEKLATLRKQDYDSAQEQVKREKLAGLNPDLNGSVTAGEGAEPVAPSPNAVQSNDSVIQDIGNVGMTFITSALGFYSNMQSAIGAGLVNKTRSIELNQRLSDTAWNLIRDNVSEFGFDDKVIQAFVDNPVEGENILPGSEVIAEAYDRLQSAFDKKVDSLPFSKSEKKKLKSFAQSLMYSQDIHSKSPSARYQSLVNEVLSDLKKSRSNFAKSSGEIGSDKSTTKALEFIGKEVYRPLEKVSLDVQKALLQRDKSYLTTFNEQDGAVSQANAEANSYKMQADLINVKEMVMAAFKTIDDKIGVSKLPPTWKLSTQAALAATEAKLLATLSTPMSFGVGMNQSTDKFGNKLNLLSGKFGF